MLLPEWTPLDAILLAYPSDKTDWAEDLATAETAFNDLIIALSAAAPVFVLGMQDVEVLAEKLPPGRQVTTLDLPLNDTWARDFAPLTISDGNQLTLLNFIFNGWGNKFLSDKDNAINRELFDFGFFQVPMRDIDLVLEGGSIESDGAGSLMTTTACLLNKNRNPLLSKEKIEENLKKNFGAEHILWLEHGHLEGDDTDAHIDTLARFCPDNLIIYQGCDDPEDSHYQALQAMAEAIKNFRNAKGEAYRTLALPWPQAKYDAEGQRLPATYANFLFANGFVFVPTYDDPADTPALALLKTALPDFQVVGVAASVFIRQHGSVHCLTMQLPRGTVHPDFLPTR
jgi:agmatine deiminase